MGRSWLWVSLLSALGSCSSTQEWKSSVVNVELSGTLSASFAEQGRKALGSGNWEPLLRQTDKYEDRETDWRGLILRGQGTFIIEESPEGKIRASGSGTAFLSGGQDKLLYLVLFFQGAGVLGITDSETKAIAFQVEHLMPMRTFTNPGDQVVLGQSPEGGWTLEVVVGLEEKEGLVSLGAGPHPVLFNGEQIGKLSASAMPGTVSLNMD